MNWTTIRLELGRTDDFPSGSVSRGYLVRLPLDESGSIEEATLARYPNRATVRRFWSTEPDECGQVVCATGHLALRCSGKPDRLLENRSFGVGDQLFLTDCDGTALPFRVAGIGAIG